MNTAEQDGRETALTSGTGVDLEGEREQALETADSLGYEGDDLSTFMFAWEETYHSHFGT